MTICASRSVSGVPVPVPVPSALVSVGPYRNQCVTAAFKQSQDRFSSLSSTTNHRDSNQNNSNAGSSTNRTYIDEQPCLRNTRQLQEQRQRQEQPRLPSDDAFNPSLRSSSRYPAGSTAGNDVEQRHPGGSQGYDDMGVDSDTDVAAAAGDGGASEAGREISDIDRRLGELHDFLRRAKGGAGGSSLTADPTAREFLASRPLNAASTASSSSLVQQQQPVIRQEDRIRPSPSRPRDDYTDDDMNNTNNSRNRESDTREKPAANAITTSSRSVDKESDAQSCDGGQGQDDHDRDQGSLPPPPPNATPDPLLSNGTFAVDSVDNNAETAPPTPPRAGEVKGRWG